MIMPKSILAFVIILLSFVSCDLLTTRTPEPPNSGRSEQITAVTPEQLFENLQNSFKEKFLDNYLTCLVDTIYLNKKFVFIPAPTAASQYPVLSNWDLNSEKQYFNNLISQTKKDVPIVLTLTQTASNVFGDSAFYQFDYSLIVPFNGSEESTTYSGLCKFSVYLDNSNKWVIVRWEDVAQNDKPSWSQLKGRFGN